jgi:hypothetical protein
MAAWLVLLLWQSDFCLGLTGYAFLDNKSQDRLVLTFQHVYMCIPGGSLRMER